MDTSSFRLVEEMRYHQAGHQDEEGQRPARCYGNVEKTLVSACLVSEGAILVINCEKLSNLDSLRFNKSGDSLKKLMFYVLRLANSNPSPHFTVTLTKRGT